jgi:hypothetical protein
MVVAGPACVAERPMAVTAVVVEGCEESALTDSL